MTILDVLWRKKDIVRLRTLYVYGISLDSISKFVYCFASGLVLQCLYCIELTKIKHIGWLTEHMDAQRSVPSCFRTTGMFASMWAVGLSCWIWIGRCWWRCCQFSSMTEMTLAQRKSLHSIFLIEVISLVRYGVCSINTPADEMWRTTFQFSHKICILMVVPTGMGNNTEEHHFCDGKYSNIEGNFLRE